MTVLNIKVCKQVVMDVCISGISGEFDNIQMNGM